MNHDYLVQSHLNAALSLVDAITGELRDDEPETAAAMEKAIRGGSMLVLRSTFAPSTRLVMLAVELVEPTGAAQTLFACELKREARQ